MLAVRPDLVLVVLGSFSVNLSFCHDLVTVHHFVDSSFSKYCGALQSIGVADCI
jgi:hypothetical protein